MKTLHAAAIVIALATGASAQTPQPPLGTYRSPSGATMKLLLDDSNVGKEVTVAELTFPPNLDSGDHTHRRSRCSTCSLVSSSTW